MKREPITRNLIACQSWSTNIYWVKRYIVHYRRWKHISQIEKGMRENATISHTCKLLSKPSFVELYVWFWIERRARAKRTGMHAAAAHLETTFGAQGWRW